MLLNYYLADQNPHRDSSYGITEYSLGLADALTKHTDTEIAQIVSRSSARLPLAAQTREIPLRTERLGARVLVDHLHGLFLPDGLIHYPKGFLPFFHRGKNRVVATLHDVIVQHYSDQYPQHRNPAVQRYWIAQTKRTLNRADQVITVSIHASRQLEEFCGRHNISPPPITVCYQGAKWEERVDQPPPAKKNYVICLASSLPHKRTAHLLEFWEQREERDPDRLELVLVGRLDTRAEVIAARCQRVSRRSFLSTTDLADLIAGARALLFPSEIEGFGLPALEALYLGTPAVYVSKTAVEEILGGIGRSSWGFELSNFESFERALATALSESAGDLKTQALRARKRFSWVNIANRVHEVYRRALS